MNYRSKALLNLALLCCVLLPTFELVRGQEPSIDERAIGGKLNLDSIWEPVVYLSHIPLFNDMYTMSNEMIIAEATVDSSGSFSFIADYLPEDDQLFRIHVSKKDAPAASLIIGGDEENHLFIVANRNARLFIDNTSGKHLFSAVSVTGFPPSAGLIEIDRISRYADSTQYNGSSMKSEFMVKAIQEKLRYVADTSSHPLVSLYALNKSNYESDFLINPGFYEQYLDKWQSEQSAYFKSFRGQLALPKNTSLWYYVLIGIAFFGLGFFLNRFLKVRGRQRESQLNSLSVQERKILNLIKMGRSNKEISEEYSIGLSTVKSHVSSIYTKLNVKSRKEAMDFK
ncbi:MAG: helix-turn-helix transcriptional regulator [Bacteroidota bacterium]